MEKKLSGIELIAQERKEQIEKHGRSVELDVFYNEDAQLVIGAIRLLQDKGIPEPPDGWNKNIWNHMTSKTKFKRMIIAGALIAAELDRIILDCENENLLNESK